ncbi:MAG: sugar phosphate isomerase/epimerase, partial [Candidatus Bathyarchaeia archaeon]
MKVGCCAWSLGWFKDSEYSIQKIGEMGFKGIELILREEKQLEDYYTKDRIKKLKEMISSYDLKVSQFVIHAPLLEGLVNRENKRK